MAAEAKLIEENRKAEAKKEADRLAAEAKKAEEARKAEADRLAAEAKKAEEARKAEADRLAAEAKKAEEARKAEADRLVAEAKKAAEIESKKENDITLTTNFGNQLQRDFVKSIMNPKVTKVTVNGKNVTKEEASKISVFKVDTSIITYNKEKTESTLEIVLTK